MKTGLQNSVCLSGATSFGVCWERGILYTPEICHLDSLNSLERGGGLLGRILLARMASTRRGECHGLRACALGDFWEFERFSWRLARLETQTSEFCVM